MNKKYRKLLSENISSDIEGFITDFLFDNYSLEQIESIGDGKNSLEVNQDPDTGAVTISLFDNRIGRDNVIYNGPCDQQSIINSIQDFMKNSLNDNVVQITEADLKRYIRESIESLMGGASMPLDQQAYDLTGQLLKVMGPEMLIAKLGESMGFEKLLKHLRKISNWAL